MIRVLFFLCALTLSGVVFAQERATSSTNIPIEQSTTSVFFPTSSTSDISEKEIEDVFSSVNNILEEDSLLKDVDTLLAPIVDPIVLFNGGSSSTKEIGNPPAHEIRPTIVPANSFIPPTMLPFALSGTSTFGPYPTFTVPVVSPKPLTGEEKSEALREVSQELKSLTTGAEEARINLEEKIERNILNEALRGATTSDDLRKKEEIGRTYAEKIKNELGREIDTLKKILPPSAVFETIEDRIEQKLKDNQDEFSKDLGRTVVFESETLRADILEIKERITLQENRVSERGGLAVYRDSDMDGISDYDEVALYGTDPLNARTSGSPLLDGEKILQGLDPLSVESKGIAFEDARERGVVVEGIFEVSDIRLVSEPLVSTSSTATSEPSAIIPKEKIALSGKALPNSFVTLYIYSTPIVVTIRANEKGEWSYELDTELSDGEHTLYVASVDTTGKIIAKSSPIPFVKEAAAVSLVTEAFDGGISENTPVEATYFQDNFFLISAGVSILALLGAVIAAGVLHKKMKSTNGNTL